MNKIKAIGFDFDGTLIISEDSKAEEMAKVFQEKFGIKKGVQQAYKRLRGQNRHHKVMALFNQFIKRKPTKTELKKIEDHFGEHYRRSMNSCPLFQCTNILKELKKQVEFLFLLSLEEEKDVRKMVKHCGLAKYFDEILGGPKSKLENLDHVIKKHHLKPREIIYVGDSPGDVIAGSKMKIKVILVGKKFDYSILRKKLESKFIFSSLCDLPTKIQDYPKK